jgi:hypothetical protein
VFAVLDSSIPDKYIQLFTHEVLESKRKDVLYSIIPSNDALTLYQDKCKVFAAIYSDLSHSSGTNHSITNVSGVSHLLINQILSIYLPSTSTTVTERRNKKAQFLLEEIDMIKKSHVSLGPEILTMLSMDTLASIFTENILWVALLSY